MQFPERLATGIRNTTVANPATGLGEYYRGFKIEPFQGLVSDYDFEKQKKNYEALQKVLLNNNTYLQYIAACHIKVPGGGTRHRFDCWNEDGSFLWHKYESIGSQSGQNHVFVAGMRIKLSNFLAMSEEEQNALIKQPPVFRALILDGDFAKRYDESKTLWN